MFKRDQSQVGRVVWYAHPSERCFFGLTDENHYVECSSITNSVREMEQTLTTEVSASLIKQQKWDGTKQHFLKGAIAGINE